MSNAVQSEIDHLLTEAEAQGMCLVPPSRAIKEGLRRRANKMADKTLNDQTGPSEVVCPYQGIFAHTAVWESLNRAERSLFAMRALCQLHPNWTFCGLSAALAHGLYLSWRYATPLHVALPPTSRHHIVTTDGISWDHASFSEAVVRQDVRVTPLDVTVADCLRTLPFLDSLGVADSWMCTTGYSKDQAAGIIRDLCSCKHGAELARLTISAADPRSENGGESLARATMLVCGYQKPDLQVEIPDPVDQDRYNRVDYLWQLSQGCRVVGELDGARKYQNPAFMGGLDAEQIRELERLRESRLAIPGTSVMRFSIADVRNQSRFCRILNSYDIPKSSDSARLSLSVRLAEQSRRPRCRRPLISPAKAEVDAGINAQT